jgi:hypothetical protein
MMSLAEVETALGTIHQVGYIDHVDHGAGIAGSTFHEIENLFHDTSLLTL